MTYEVTLIESGRTTPTDHCTRRFATEKAARKYAAKLLGSQSLRGASTWTDYTGEYDETVAYQFGPKTEDNGYDTVYISYID